MNIGKKTAWKAWTAYPEVNDAFIHIAANPFSILDDNSSHFKLIEQLVVKFYGKANDIPNINIARKVLYCERDVSSLDRIPPTRVSNPLAKPLSSIDSIYQIIFETNQQKKLRRENPRECITDN